MVDVKRNIQAGSSCKIFFYALFTTLFYKNHRDRLLVENTRLPARPLYPTVGQEKGIELDVLDRLRSDWLHSFDWETQQAELNEFKHYTAVIEGITVHFVHEKSTDPDAIPVILVHGWPGSFQEFLPVIKPLTQSRASSTGKKLSYKFNVVIPSLPGFVFSSPPPLNWTVQWRQKIMSFAVWAHSSTKSFQIKCYHTLR
ncbi:Alpha/Beta hydrolase protein [Mycena rebaudengoi]|nr:Alpha/Beta hydrolase protein [Mycena rebaudengoi]